MWYIIFTPIDKLTEAEVTCKLPEGCGGKRLLVSKVVVLLKWVKLIWQLGQAIGGCVKMAGWWKWASGERVRGAELREGILGRAGLRG